MTYRSLTPNPYGAGIRQYQVPADKVIGYPQDGWWGIVEPIAYDLQNIVDNPSLEMDTTGWSTSGAGAIARVATEQRYGGWSLRVTPSALLTEGVFYGTFPLIAGGKYRASIWFKGTAGLKYDALIASTASVAVSQISKFTATGYWQLVSILYNETATASRRFYIRKDGSANLTPFYVDGLMVPNIFTSDPLLYFDGDTVGYVPNKKDFYWTGVPHASVSVMKANTRAGGQIRSLSMLGVTLLATMGLGLATPDNVVLPLALPGGEQYQDTLATARTFDLLGILEAGTPTQLKRLHSDLAALLDTRRRPFHQEMTLMYEEQNECGDSAGELLRIQCSFAGGMEGVRDNHYREDLGLRFRIHLPYVAVNMGSKGAALNLDTTIANANYIIHRDALGNYSALGTGGNALVLATLYEKGVIYAGGQFTLMGGVANTDYIAKWDTAVGAWTALGSGVSGGAGVYALAMDALGNVIAGGPFTAMGGVANTRNIAKWNGAAWVAMGTGADVAGSQVETLVAGGDGRVYAGGIWNSMGGVANTANLAAWTGAAWVSITPGGAPNAVVDALAWGPDGNLYVAGDFTTINGQAILRIAKYNPTTGAWSALGTGIPAASGNILTMAFGPDGILYGGGTIISIGGQSVSEIAYWNGVAWSELGGGISGGTVYSMAWNPINNMLYVGGNFLTAGDVPMPDSITLWNGSQFLTADVQLPGNADINAIAIDENTGAMVFGFQTAGTATAASVTTILTNSGTADTFPILKWIAATGGTDVLQIYQLSNSTTGEKIYFNGLTLISGETLTFDFRPGQKSITSDFRGDLTGLVAPGSNMAIFHLAHGANTIAVFQKVTTGSSPDGYAYWYPAYAEIEDSVR